MVKFLNFICSGKIKLREKFSGLCQVNPPKWATVTVGPAQIKARPVVLTVARGGSPVMI